MYFLANFRYTYSLPAGLLPPSWEPETPLITKGKEMDQNEMRDRIQTAHSPTLAREGGACSRGWGGGGRGKSLFGIASPERSTFLMKVGGLSGRGRGGGSYNARYVKGYTGILHLFKFWTEWDVRLVAILSKKTFLDSPLILFTQELLCSWPYWPVWSLLLS